MLLPILEERRHGAGASDALIKTINTRIAGGRREINKEPSQVGLDESSTSRIDESFSGHR
jgi:DNA excision repair protein ERCC-4